MGDGFDVRTFEICIAPAGGIVSSAHDQVSDTDHTREGVATTTPLAVVAEKNTNQAPTPPA